MTVAWREVNSILGLRVLQRDKKGLPACSTRHATRRLAPLVDCRRTDIIALLPPGNNRLHVSENTFLGLSTADLLFIQYLRQLLTNLAVQDASVADAHAGRACRSCRPPCNVTLQHDNSCVNEVAYSCISQLAEPTTGRFGICTPIYVLPGPPSRANLRTIELPTSSYSSALG